MKAVYILSTIKLKCATYATTIHTINGMEVLKTRYWIVMFDDRHGGHSVKKWQLEDRMKWTSASLRMHYVVYIDCRVILLAHAIQLSKIASISMANVWYNATFTVFSHDAESAELRVGIPRKLWRTLFQYVHIGYCRKCDVRNMFDYQLKNHAYTLHYKLSDNGGELRCAFASCETW